jgi:hypothetical protein
MSAPAHPTPTTRECTRTDLQTLRDELAAALDSAILARAPWHILGAIASTAGLLDMMLRLSRGEGGLDHLCDPQELRAALAQAQAARTEWLAWRRQRRHPHIV